MSRGCVCARADVCVRARVSRAANNTRPHSCLCRRHPVAAHHSKLCMPRSIKLAGTRHRANTRPAEHTHAVCRGTLLAMAGCAREGMRVRRRCPMAHRIVCSPACVPACHHSAAHFAHGLSLAASSASALPSSRPTVFACARAHTHGGHALALQPTLLAHRCVGPLVGTTI